MAYISFQPSDYFSTKLYTGNSNAGSSNTQSITGVGFQPDLTWIKNYQSAADHALFDAVRGATKFVNPNQTTEQQTVAGTLTAFGADGFTLGTDLTQGVVNNLNETFVSWNWKMGTTSGLTGGTITPSAYSINTTARQSIIAYTGTGSAATIPHGLGVKPDLIITKQYNTGRTWSTYFSTLGATKHMPLNTTTVASTGTTYWNDTEPTSTVFSVGSQDETNGTGTMIAYCFANRKGYSNFGSYFGNSSNDGPFIYTGFRPKMMIIRGATTGENWMIFGKNPPYNQIDRYLQIDTNVADMTNIAPGDFCSNGFKIRDDDNKINEGNTYVYAAFAEFPIVSSNSKPGVAR